MLRKLIFISLLMLIHSGCERPTEFEIVDDGIAPAVPSGLAVYTAHDGFIGIQWIPNNEPDLDGYLVYRSTNDSVYMKIAFTRDNFFEDDSLCYDTTYFYKVSAIDISGKESNLTPSVSASPVNIYPPHTPGLNTVNCRNWEGDLSVYVSWYKNFDHDILGYEVHRSKTPGFTPGDTTLIGFSSSADFTDTLQLELYQNYYYKIIAVDKGTLKSNPSSEMADAILDIPELIFPADGSDVNYFTQFLIGALQVPANYEIIVQTNQFFGNFWSKSFYSDVINDTIKVVFDPPYLYPDFTYYCRLVTYSSGNIQPNSISPLYNFTIIP